MRIAIGIVCSALWILWVGQLVSVVDWGLAQRLGLQEKSENVDPLFGRLELWTARWDLLWLWTLPTAGVLMLVDHSWWPFVAMIGGGAYVDAGGREAAKVLGLHESDVRTGNPSEVRTLFVTYAVFVIIGGIAIVAGLIEAT